ncbi:MAG: hypothetical protein WCP34_06445 [Pseudomonadota bacterium]
MNIRAIILGVLLAPFVSFGWPVTTNSVTVKVSEQGIQRFAIPQGEARVLEVSYRIGNSVAPLTGLTADFLYRPNGSNLWWTIPGTVVAASGTVRVAWDYTRDPGFLAYEGWIRLTNSAGSPVYRLKIDLSMIRTPGFVPNASGVTVSGIDFWAVPYTNSPWATIVSMLASDVMVRAEMRTAMGQTGDVAKAYGASQLAAHVIASDPHGDRAAASAAAGFDATTNRIVAATNTLDLATIARDYPRSNPSNWISLAQVPAQTTQLYVASAGAAASLSAGADSNRLAAALTNMSDSIHGARSGGNLHALADGSGAGFLSALQYLQVVSMAGRTNVWDAGLTNLSIHTNLTLASGAHGGMPTAAQVGAVSNGGARLVAGADISLSSTIISNGANITISYTGAVSSVGVSAATATGISYAVVAEWAATGTASKATTAATVTGVQSNTIATALQPASTNGWEVGSHTNLATLAQGIAGTNAQTLVTVLTTNLNATNLKSGTIPWDRFVTGGAAGKIPQLKDTATYEWVDMTPTYTLTATKIAAAGGATNGGSYAFTVTGGNVITNGGTVAVAATNAQAIAVANTAQIAALFGAWYPTNTVSGTLTLDWATSAFFSFAPTNASYTVAITNTPSAPRVMQLLLTTPTNVIPAISWPAGATWSSQLDITSNRTYFVCVIYDGGAYALVPLYSR